MKTRANSTSGGTSLRRRAFWWLLVDGNRLVVAGCLVAGFVAALALCLEFRFVTVDYEGNVRRLFASGLTAGLLSLVTVTLSINQLILSRVFGAPNELGDRFDGTLSLQQSVERYIDDPVAPSDPAALLGAIGDALAKQASALPDRRSDGGETDLAEYREELGRYADDIRDVQSGAETRAILSAVLSTGYATNFAATRRIAATRDDLSEDARDRLDAARELLRAVAVLRQYLKTIATQQQLARLSRLVAYTGVAGVATSMLLALVYNNSSGAVLPAGWLPPVVTAGFAVMVLPLAVLVAYILRVATVARYTVSAGPLVPPEETAHGDGISVDR